MVMESVLSVLMPVELNACTQWLCKLGVDSGICTAYDLSGCVETCTVLTLVTTKAEPR